MQYINLFCCLIIVFSAIKGMDRKRLGNQIEPKPRKTYRTDPEVTAELRVLQAIQVWNSLLKEVAPSKINPHGQ